MVQKRETHRVGGFPGSITFLRGSGWTQKDCIPIGGILASSNPDSKPLPSKSLRRNPDLWIPLSRVDVKRTEVDGSETVRRPVAGIGRDPNIDACRTRLPSGITFSHSQANP